MKRLKKSKNKYATAINLFQKKKQSYENSNLWRKQQ